MFRFYGVLAISVYVILLTTGLESKTTKYLEEPSSYNITCNPYGDKLELHCTIEEPADLKLSSKLLLLWYWTPPGGDNQSESDTCQIYPQYQCDQYVGKNKYEFLFKRNRVRSRVLRTMDLLIDDVGIEDQGCYSCRPWLNSLPLPIEESSKPFCLGEEDVYDHLPECNQMAPTSSTVAINVQTTSCERLTVLGVSTSSSKGDSKGFAIWHYILIGLCAVLGLLSVLQAPIVLYLCYLRHVRKNESRRNLAVIGDIPKNESYTNGKSSPSSPPPHFIGTYSYIQPCEDDEKIDKNVYSLELKKDISNSAQTSCTHSCSQAEPSARLEDSSSASLPILSPGTHIYQTLDKYLDQPDDQTQLKQSEDELEAEMADEANKTHASYDWLFDDPNYSHVQIIASHTPRHLLSLSTPNIPCSQNCMSGTSFEKYDKLQPKTSEAEYAYAYSHLVKLRKQLKKLKRKNPSSSHHQVELLRVAAMGTYEMDPSFVSTLEGESNTSNNGANKKETEALPHQYQSLDKTTMASENGYTDLMNN